MKEECNKELGCKVLQPDETEKVYLFDGYFVSAFFRDNEVKFMIGLSAYSNLLYNPNEFQRLDNRLDLLLLRNNLDGIYNNTVKENVSKVIELYKDYKGTLGIGDIENNFKEEDVDSIEINEYLVGRTCEREKYKNGNKKFKMDSGDVLYLEMINDVPYLTYNPYFIRISLSSFNSFNIKDKLERLRCEYGIPYNVIDAIDMLLLDDINFVEYNSQKNVYNNPILDKAMNWLRHSDTLCSDCIHFDYNELADCNISSEDSIRSIINTWKLVPSRDILKYNFLIIKYKNELLSNFNISYLDNIKIETEDELKLALNPSHRINIEYVITRCDVSLFKEGKDIISYKYLEEYPDIYIFKGAIWNEQSRKSYDLVFNNKIKKFFIDGYRQTKESIISYMKKPEVKVSPKFILLYKDSQLLWEFLKYYEIINIIPDIPEDMIKEFNNVNSVLECPYLLKSEFITDDVRYDKTVIDLITTNYTCLLPYYDISRILSVEQIVEKIKSGNKYIYGTLNEEFKENYDIELAYSELLLDNAISQLEPEEQKFIKDKIKIIVELLE